MSVSMTVASSQVHVKPLSKYHRSDWPRDDRKYEKYPGAKLSTNEKGVTFGITSKDAEVVTSANWIAIGVKGVK
ncbi:uncharacterized protein Bfra_009496ca [Botrytis fragariae]|uniref:Uncharacterized protein n=1 Tax=Botrytis fragariae TaxID=1964551 RepID=A0A8H6ANY5_9HELO|nr:uncharacterized protein Bfra_009496ca [Botrytis fragariae]KAF5870942.1 hypothetical protein Bfra_009496ca [Botrytis fragariae]